MAGLCLGGAAVVVLPNVRSSRLNANESAAIATLKYISSAQSQVQAAGCIDANGNGSGEYGFFAELAGVRPVRTQDPQAGGALVDPPVLSPRFGEVVGGRVRSGGYVFQMFLRGPDGAWIAEASGGGGVGRGVDPAKAEVEWLCYAWPIEHGRTGKRAFLISQGGDVFASNLSVEVYSGDAGPPPGLAAHLPRDGAWVPAVNECDALGNTWVVV